MTVLLELKDGWRIETDSRNFILSERVIRTNQKTEEEYEAWTPQGFYGTLPGVLHASLIREVVEEGAAKDIHELAERMERIAEEYGQHRTNAQKQLPPPPPKVAKAAPEPEPEPAPAPIKKKKKKRKPGRVRADAV